MREGIKNHEINYLVSPLDRLLQAKKRGPLTVHPPKRQLKAEEQAEAMRGLQVWTRMVS